FALDDADVALDTLRRVLGKPEYITCLGKHPLAAPRLQHFAVLTDVILALRSPLQTFGIDTLQPDKDLSASGPRRLGNKVGDSVAKRVHLHHDVNLEAILVP